MLIKNIKPFFELFTNKDFEYLYIFSFLSDQSIVFSDGFETQLPFIHKIFLDLTWGDLRPYEIAIKV